MDRPDLLNGLPDELFVEVARRLGPRALAALAQVSRECRRRLEGVPEQARLYLQVALDPWLGGWAAAIEYCPPAARPALARLAVARGPAGGGWGHTSSAWGGLLVFAAGAGETGAALQLAALETLEAADWTSRESAAIHKAYQAMFNAAAAAIAAGHSPTAWALLAAKANQRRPKCLLKSCTDYAGSMLMKRLRQEGPARCIIASLKRGEPHGEPHSESLDNLRALLEVLPQEDTRGYVPSEKDGGWPPMSPGAAEMLLEDRRVERETLMRHVLCRSGLETIRRFFAHPMCPEPVWDFLRYCYDLEVFRVYLADVLLACPASRANRLALKLPWADTLGRPDFSPVQLEHFAVFLEYVDPRENNYHPLRWLRNSVKFDPALWALLRRDGRVPETFLWQTLVLGVLLDGFRFESHKLEEKVVLERVQRVLADEGFCATCFGEDPDSWHLVLHHIFSRGMGGLGLIRQVAALPGYHESGGGATLLLALGGAGRLDLLREVLDNGWADLAEIEAAICVMCTGHEPPGFDPEAQRCRWLVTDAPSEAGPPHRGRIPAVLILYEEFCRRSTRELPTAAWLDDLSELDRRRGDDSPPRDRGGDIAIAMFRSARHVGVWSPPRPDTAMSKTQGPATGYVNQSADKCIVYNTTFSKVLARFDSLDAAERFAAEENQMFGGHHIALRPGEAAPPPDTPEGGGLFYSS